MTVDRVSSDDLMSLAADRGRAPMQVGAVLILATDDDFDVATLIGAIEARLPGIPRLRQRLVQPGAGLGRPIWVDDVDFSMGSHVSVMACPEPGGMDAVFLAAADVLTDRLPRSRPLWAASIVTGVDNGITALIFVFHHLLADGVAGLAVLAALATPEPPPGDPAFPRLTPTRKELFVDSVRSRVDGLRSWPTHLRRAAVALAQLGPSVHHTAARTSLNRPIGARRRFERVTCSLTDVRAAAHAAGGTVNDFALTAVTGALHSLLQSRGERADDFTISVPFSSRVLADAGALGNQSGAVPLELPATGESHTRCREIAGITRAAKASPSGSSSALLGPLFRVLARLGLFQTFVDHQRTIHTIVTNVTGSRFPIMIGGAAVIDLVPLTAIVGNVTVAFAVSSYMERLTITLVADPDACPDLDDLCRFVDEECAELTGSVAVAQEQHRP